MKPVLIIALDFSSENDALALVDQLNPLSCALKVGNEMFTLLGPVFVRKLVQKGFKVFLDLKFHDIPNTVARACQVAADLGVWMLNLHAAGGLAMMSAAKSALDDFGSTKPLLIAVTVLTSFDEHALRSVGVAKPLVEQVQLLTKIAHQAALDGVVCSAYEAAAVKRDYPSFITVTPGIRLQGSTQDDQSRIMTPVQAREQGSDFLVIGRPVTRASNPLDVVESILESFS